MTLHRVVLETVTNAGRHAPEATYVAVSARVKHDQAADVLVLDVVHDGAAEPSGDEAGYGLIGMVLAHAPRILADRLASTERGGITTG